MAYNLYQVQMARAWAERVEKENAQAEKFWSQQVTRGLNNTYSGNDGASIVSSACPSGFTSKTSYLKSRLERLESELTIEREHRKKVEDDLNLIKTGLLTGQLGSKPATPTGHTH